MATGKDLFRGRLGEELACEAKDYLSCLKEDDRILEIDLKVLKAHCQMLNKQGYLSGKELKEILSALKKIRVDFKEGKLEKILQSKDRQFTDIHPVIEKYLIETCGVETGGKVNLGRSRNDQIAADLRIYLREETLEVGQLLIDFIQSLLDLANSHSKTVFPGYTHRQPAQVTTYAHYLLSYVDYFLRALERLGEVYKRVNLNPLGASALAGTNIALDRKYTAKLLGFDGVLENSIDAVSNRDFLLETANAFTLIMLALSRMARDLVFWSSYEADFIELADKFTDISTAMPQKKNPSVLELLLGRTHLALGLFNHLLGSICGLETGYNQELQELKSSLWKIVDLTKDSLKIMEKVFLTLRIDRRRIEEILAGSFITAVDLVEYFLETRLVKNFREAHFFVGNIVKELIKKNRTLGEINSEEIRRMSKEILGKEIALSPSEIAKITNPHLCIQRRKSLGGPAPKEVERMIKLRKEDLNKKKSFFGRP